MDCCGTYFTHAQCQSCDNVHVPSATEWTASVHTLHMPKAVITFVLKGIDSFRTYFARVQSSDNVRVESAIQNGLPRAVITLVFRVLRNGVHRYIRDTCPKL